ncbi:hypothetical protein GP486_001936 [Trichoglossum hirsutum]|uniref:Uncharacterized protein n=1 Tax=Trichoglossum hirsutum TaxID=265104 RepID=A0A9P8LFY8_9PEZI|nr:hypothetical protein GP486_001936 [Trichoglossum hirsutum]
MRRAAIRRHVAKTIIDSIVKAVEERSDNEISNTINEISTYLEPYSYSNNQARRDHLRELCRLGVELWAYMNEHPSQWEFGQWDGEGSGMVFPELLRDNITVVGGGYSI